MATPARELLRMPEKMITPIAQQKDSDYLAALEKRAALDKRFAEAVARERRAKNRLRAQAQASQTVVVAGNDDAVKRDRERRAADAERAQALAAGGGIVAALPPAFEFEAAVEEQRLLQPLIFEANAAVEAVVGRLLFEGISRHADYIRENRRRKREADEISKQQDEDLKKFFSSFREAGYACFCDVDMVRRFASS